MAKATFEITVDKGIEIGYKIFGENTANIKFTTQETATTITYSWVLENSEEFKKEANMPSAFYYLPHIIYYIKSYPKNGIQEKILTNTDDLYKWYSELVRQTNKNDQSELKKTVNQILINAKTEMEKAKLIFQWVQKTYIMWLLKTEWVVLFQETLLRFLKKNTAIVKTWQI